MLSRCLMEEVEQSGRRIVGEVQQGVERRGRRFGLNKDRRVLSHPAIDIFSVLKDEWEPSSCWDLTCCFRESLQADAESCTLKAVELLHFETLKKNNENTSPCWNLTWCFMIFTCVGGFLSRHSFMLRPLMLLYGTFGIWFSAGEAISFMLWLCMFLHAIVLFVLWLQQFQAI